MYIHKFEKIWLIFGIATLLVFLSVVGVSAFYLGNQPPSCMATVDPEKVDTQAPFDVASAFNYTPGEVEVPLGAKVKVIATTKDVIHGFSVAGTNINMMLTPGYISEYITTFDKAGQYLILCNEYCGTGHHLMTSKIKVVE
jgi:cytochrome c oxidase subunit 2